MLPVITVFEGEVAGGGLWAETVVEAASFSQGGGDDTASSTSCSSMVTISCWPASFVD